MSAGYFVHRFIRLLPSERSIHGYATAIGA
jgi:hypothetical protein